MKKTLRKTIYRFFLRQTVLPMGLLPGQQYSLNNQEEELFQQLTRVLRCQIGEQIILLNPNYVSPVNTKFFFEITSISKKHLDLKLIHQEQFEDSNHALELAVALPNKPAKLDFILEKTTELGITKIHLISTELSQFAHQLKLERLQKIIIEAGEQSERARLPLLQFHASLPEFFDNLKEVQQFQNLFIAMERSIDTPSLLTANLTNFPIILVGPEGGFSSSEKQAIADQKIQTFNLGGSILRMETACILALGIASLKLSQ